MDPPLSDITAEQTKFAQPQATIRMISVWHADIDRPLEQSAIKCKEDWNQQCLAAWGKGPGGNLFLELPVTAHTEIDITAEHIKMAQP